MKKTYHTLSQTINSLKKVGYTVDFNIEQQCLMSYQSKVKMLPSEFEIDEVFRFEGDSNPDDQSVLYAISSNKHKVKGVLVNGYGISTVGATDAIIKKLNTLHR